MKLAFFQRNAAPVSFALAVGVILGVAGGALAAAASASPWVASIDSKVRLVSGTVDIDGVPALVAGIQLRMNPGWKTYWKNPGDSGVPPSFDWTGSKNLKHAEVLFPAPHRFADANGTAIGYDDQVVFPVKLTPERAGEPIELKLAFAYGLCKDLCIPNDVSLGLTLEPNAGKGDAMLLQSALALVPKPARAGLLPEVSGVEGKLEDASPKLVVEAVFPPGATSTDLYIDGGDVFIPVPASLGPLADGKERFAVSFLSPSEAATIKGKILTLTLVSNLGSTETARKVE